MTLSILRIEVQENSLELPVQRAKDNNIVELLSNGDGPVEGRDVTVSVLSEPVAGPAAVEPVDLMLNNGSTDAEPVLHTQALISFTVTFGYASYAATLLRADMAIAADSDTFVVLPLSSK